MKTKSDILLYTEACRQKLLAAVAEQELLGDSCPIETELEIYTLFHQIEVLFWILEINTPADDLMENHTRLLQ